ncbi:nucleoside-diphosphate sugar epimerase [Cohnella faecalis]|nr:nucleoside-diphosphate sugar epimerase [Cohnella faecalis]
MLIETMRFSDERSGFMRGWGIDGGMEELMTEIVVHLSQSHQQMARILDAKRQVTVRLSHIVQGLPDVQPQLNGLTGLLGSSSQVNKSIVAYLNSLADFQDAVADSLTNVVKAITVSDEE